jgi:hypothetical protein
LLEVEQVDRQVVEVEPEDYRLFLTKLSIPASPVPVTVGAGGGQAPSQMHRYIRKSFYFCRFTITSTGGGRRSGTQLQDQEDQVVRWRSRYTGCTGGAGNTPPVSPPQGNHGGTGIGTN